MEKSIGPALQSHLLILFVLLAGLTSLNGQVFSDNFNTITSATWTETGQIGISPWSVFRSGVDFGARRNTSPSQLELSNDVTGVANANGWVMVSVPTTAFGAPYNPVLSANTGVITWTFNMRQIRTDPSGFDLSNYGVALILAGETATNFSTGNGYAVVLGQSGATDAVRLVSYVTGLNPNSGLTDIIASNGALADIGAEYLSIKVTYNPCNNNQWQLFVRNDGTTAFADPAVGTLTLQGTASNNLYTNIPLNMMAAHWSAATTALQTAFFDNITVSVLNPSIVLGPNPMPCVGSTTTTLSYGSPMNSPTQYSIDWNAAANSAGFTDITNAALPVSPIPITIPVGAVVGTYSGSLTVRNTTTLCSSEVYSISVMIKPCTAPAPSTLDWVLLQNGEEVFGIPGCVSSTDCTNDVICYGLRYTPLYTGNMTSYTNSLRVNCNDGINPVLSNASCVMTDNSIEFDGCSQNDLVLFFASSNTSIYPVFKGVPLIIHQICFSIPTTDILIVNRDNLAGTLGSSIDSINGGGAESDTITHFIPLVIDSSIACAPLPLKWLSFTAARYDNLMSKLDWATADEINVSHFEVQRSNDNGRSFHSIDIVKASTQNEAVNHYQYIDRYAQNGKNFYRIRQVDFDQKSDVSPIRAVTFKGDHAFSINAWPNPVTDELTIDLRSADETLHLTIVDISGRIVWKGVGDSGSSMQTVDVSAFGAGVYSLIAEGDTVRDVKKIVVMK